MWGKKVSSFPFPSLFFFSHFFLSSPLLISLFFSLFSPFLPLPPFLSPSFFFSFLFFSSFFHFCLSFPSSLSFLFFFLFVFISLFFFFFSPFFSFFFFFWERLARRPPDAQSRTANRPTKPLPPDGSPSLKTSLSPNRAVRPSLLVALQRAACLGGGGGGGGGGGFFGVFWVLVTARTAPFRPVPPTMISPAALRAMRHRINGTPSSSCPSASALADGLVLRRAGGSAYPVPAPFIAKALADPRRHVRAADRRHLPAWGFSRSCVEVSSRPFRRWPPADSGRAPPHPKSKIGEIRAGNQIARRRPDAPLLWVFLWVSASFSFWVSLFFWMWSADAARWARTRLLASQIEVAPHWSRTTHRLAVTAAESLVATLSSSLQGRAQHGGACRATSTRPAPHQDRRAPRARLPTTPAAVVVECGSPLAAPVAAANIPGAAMLDLDQIASANDFPTDREIVV